MCIPKPSKDLLRTYSVTVLSEPTFGNAVRLKESLLDYIDDTNVNLVYCNSEVCSKNGRIRFAHDVLNKIVG